MPENGNDQVPLRIAARRGSRKAPTSGKANMIKPFNKMMATAVTLSLFAVPLWATEEVQKSNGQKILEGLLPLLILFGLLWFFLRRVGRRNEPYMERAKVHMERIEKQNDEIIGLLIEIAEKNGIPNNPAP